MYEDEVGWSDRTEQGVHDAAGSSRSQRYSCGVDAGKKIARQGTCTATYIKRGRRLSV